ncbi:hypothetical protein WA026_001759 [Henosepilachna vigintioctopunctata]|uniref:Uncharacterized protein n=1 Tax=Henosepilachna vigintioctopunctata TaxID=420089 RepID=A0AAW1ULG7_9CUCU
MDRLRLVAETLKINVYKGCVYASSYTPHLGSTHGTLLFLWSNESDHHMPPRNRATLIILQIHRTGRHSPQEAESILDVSALETNEGDGCRSVSSSSARLIAACLRRKAGDVRTNSRKDTGKRKRNVIIGA